MKKMLLLLALIAVPAWAADVAPAPSASEPSAQTTQAAPKHQATTPKANKTEMKAAAKASATACYKLICGGVLGCFTKGCASSCGPC